MIKSPKEKFQAVAARRDYLEQIVAHKAFEEACDYALLQMSHTCPTPSNPQDACDAQWRMIGAHTFVNILKTLHEIQQPPTKPTEQGLNYQAGV